MSKWFVALLLIALCGLGCGSKQIVRQEVGPGVPTTIEVRREDGFARGVARVEGGELELRVNRYAKCVRVQATEHPVRTWYNDGEHYAGPVIAVGCGIPLVFAATLNPVGLALALYSLPLCPASALIAGVVLVAMPARRPENTKLIRRGAPYNARCEERIASGVVRNDAGFSEALVGGVIRMSPELARRSREAPLMLDGHPVELDKESLTTVDAFGTLFPVEEVAPPPREEDSRKPLVHVQGKALEEPGFIAAPAVETPAVPARKPLRRSDVADGGS